jgi:integrase
MLLKAPRLWRNRHGTFCFRLKGGGRERRVSLGTKDARAASIIAFELNAHVERERAMKNPKAADILAKLNRDGVREYKINIQSGEIEADGPEDHALAMDAFDRAAKALGPGVLTRVSPVHAAAPAPAPAQIKSLPLSEVGRLWIAQCESANGERTVDAKKSHFKHFVRQVSGDVEVNAIVKATMVAFKTSQQNDGLKAKTIDNKLMSLHDLFSFALANGYYTVSNANPVSGLFILNRKNREAKNNPYQPFTEEEITRFFEPASYRAAMELPDFWWPPLLAIYTGMRISDATAIACKHVLQAPNGVDYIHVPKSKTSAGKRNVPICRTLIELGFLDYVSECRAAKVQQIFPHRSKVKGGYSKRLSERMTSYLVELGIKAVDFEDRPVKDDHKSFHSFRVNVITALANAGANAAQVMQIVGHKRADANAVHMGYVRDLPDLQQVVDKLEWPINVEALRYRGEFDAFLNDHEQWNLRSEAAKKRHAKERGAGVAKRGA